MGFFDRFKRKPGTAAPSEQFAECSSEIASWRAERDLDSLLDRYDDAYVAGLEERELDELRTLCVRAIEGCLDEAQDEDLRDALESVESRDVPVDLEPHRARLRERGIAAFRAQVTDWLARDELAALAEAIEWLETSTGAWEVERVGEAAHAAMRSEALELLRARLPVPTARDYARTFERLAEQRGDEAFAPLYAKRWTFEDQCRERGLEISTEPYIPEPDSAAFDDTIAAASSDADHREACLVLGDHLQDRGHPRGGLIAKMIAAEAEPSYAGDVTEYLAAHAASLLGPLAAYHAFSDTAAYGLVWRRGFIHRASLSTTDEQIFEILEALFHHPSARHLAELAIGLNDGDDERIDEIAAYVARELPASVRALHFCNLPDAELDYVPWTRLGLQPLWDRLPSLRLRTLVVDAGDVTPGTIVAPVLEHLAFKLENPEPETFHAIATATCPRLSSLELWRANEPGLAAILARADLALEHLALVSTDETDVIARALEDAPLARGLRQLDLSFGTLTDGAAARLALARDYLPRVECLNVTRNRLTSAGIGRLRAAYPTVIALEQDSV